MHTLVTRKPRTPEKSRVRGSSVFIIPYALAIPQESSPRKAPRLPHRQQKALRNTFRKVFHILSSVVMYDCGSSYEFFCSYLLRRVARRAVLPLTRSLSSSIIRADTRPSKNFIIFALLFGFVFLRSFPDLCYYNTLSPTGIQEPVFMNIIQPSHYVFVHIA